MESAEKDTARFSSRVWRAGKLGHAAFLHAGGAEGEARKPMRLARTLG
jgi:hypothetical protein